MKLTNQDKLALALTSAGSQRSLAKLLGVSHQKVGRWLKEGQEGGAKKIPDEATATIDLAFKLHKQVTREQAKVDRLPYNPDLPIFINRPQLQNGKPGERVYAEHTQYLAPDLQQMFIAWAHDTKQFIQVSIRSTINLYSYIKAKPSDSPQQLASRVRTESLGLPFDRREAEKPGSNRAAPLFTPYERIGRGADLRLVLKGVKQKLQQKHEPHAGPENPGTALADQYLFQTTPGQYDQQTPTGRQPSKAAAKPLKGKAYRTALKRR